MTAKCRAKDRMNLLPKSNGKQPLNKPTGASWQLPNTPDYGEVPSRCLQQQQHSQQAKILTFFSSVNPLLSFQESIAYQALAMANMPHDALQSGASPVAAAAVPRQHRRVVNGQKDIKMSPQWPNHLSAHWKQPEPSSE